MLSLFILFFLDILASFYFDHGQRSEVSCAIKAEPNVLFFFNYDKGIIVMYFLIVG